MSSLESEIDRFLKELDKLSSLRGVAFTGAGISAESGIPTFRGKGGIWEKFPPWIFGNPPGLAAAFILAPGKLRDFIVSAGRAFLNAEPSEGHRALARLEEAGIINGVITQNIDRLHEKAGSRNVIKLHGDVGRMRCTGCGARMETGEEVLRDLIRALEGASGRRKMLRIFRTGLPRCECGRIMRPDIVLFMEPLPMDELMRAYAHAEACNFMIITGTSGVVYPAAEIPFIAIKNGAAVIEVNPESTAYTPHVTLFLKGTAGKVLPVLAEKLLSYALRRFS